MYETLSLAVLSSVLILRSVEQNRKVAAINGKGTFISGGIAVSPFAEEVFPR